MSSTTLFGQIKNTLINPEEPFTLERPANYRNASWDDLGERVSDLQNTVVEGNTNALKDEDRYAAGDINAAELALRHVGRGGEAVGEAYGTALGLATPQWIGDAAKETLTWGVEQVLETKQAQIGLEYLKNNPRVARNVEAGLGVLELGLPKAMIEPVRRALSAAANYIPNHYTPSIKNLKDMPKDYQYLAQRLLAFNVKGVKTYKEAFHLAQKLTGAGKWAKDGFVGGVNSILNPRARALYDKHGINSTSQKIVKQEFKLYEQQKKAGNHGVAERHKEKAVAQMNYNKYITAQTAHKGKIAEVLDNVTKSVSYGGMQPLTKQNYIDSAKQQKSTISSQNARGKKTETTLTASDADLSYVFDTAQRIWGMNKDAGNKLVVKRNTGIGGNHGSDAITNKNAVHNYMKKLYASEGITDPVAIYKHIKGLPLDERPKGVVMLNKSIADVKKNGLWMSSSHVGSAVVEGGVNVMTKILPNQRAMSFVSDVHDFLEKVPVLGKVLGAALPNGEMSITPPIYADLRTRKVKDRQAKNKGAREDIVSLGGGQQGVVTDADINEYVNATVPISSVAKQALVNMPIQGAILANGLYDYGDTWESQDPRLPRQMLDPRVAAR